MVEKFTMYKGVSHSALPAQVSNIITNYFSQPPPDPLTPRQEMPLRHLSAVQSQTRPRSRSYLDRGIRKPPYSRNELTTCTSSLTLDSDYISLSAFGK